MLGSWNPENERASIASSIDLQPFIAQGEENLVDSACRDLSPETIAEITPLMTQTRDFWLTAAAHFSSAEILNLMRFFTLAEEQHSALAAGNKSPVIGLNKLLKSRHESLPSDFLQWLKAHSSNRFIPNGSIL